MPGACGTGYNKNMSTTALYKALIQAGVSEDTAERAVEDLAHTDDVATKADLAKLESKIMDKMAELRDQLTTRILIAIGINIGAVGLMFAAAGFFSG